MYINEFLKLLYADLSAARDITDGDVSILEKTLEEYVSNDNPTAEQLTVEVMMEDAISGLYFDLDLLDAAIDSVQLFMLVDLGPKPEMLIQEYFKKIQEKYQLKKAASEGEGEIEYGDFKPDSRMDWRDRIKFRILDQEIFDIEDALKHEGLPIFGGYSCFEEWMEDQGESDEDENGEDTDVEEFEEAGERDVE